MRHSQKDVWKRLAKVLSLAVMMVLASVPAPASQRLAEEGRLSSNRLAHSIEALKVAGAEFQTIRLFKDEAASAASRGDLHALVSDGTVVRINNAEVKSLLKRSPRQFTLPLPSRGELELIEVDYSKLRVEGPSGEDLSSTNTARHYQGIVRGDNRSLAAISVFRNLQTGQYEVAGVYSTRGEGNTIIGRLKTHNPSNDHIVYPEAAVRGTPATVECGVGAEEL